MTTRRILLLLAALATATRAEGQTRQSTDSLTLTLEDALGRLSSREPRLAAAHALREIAGAARGEALAARRNAVIPMLSVSYGAQRVAQNQFVEIGRQAGGPSAPADQTDAFNRVFTSPNTRTAGLTASVRPYDGGVSGARLDATRAAAEAAGYAEVQVRAALETEVIARYADVQLERRLRDVADSAISQAERALRVTQQAVAQGRTPEFEIWRVEADVQALRPARINADRQLRLAELALRQLLELPEGVPLRLTTSAEPWSTEPSNDTTNDTTNDTRGGMPMRTESTGRTRVAFRELEAREREATAQHRAARRALLPVLELSLVHQRLAYPLRNTNWGGPYYQNTQVGVSLTMPLDLTGASATRIESAAASVRLAQAQRRDAERRFVLEQADIEAQRDASRVVWQAAMSGAASAEKALRVAQARHDVGRSSLLELQDARLTWQRAMAARAQAAHDRTVIEARAARLDRLPLLSTLP